MIVGSGAKVGLLGNNAVLPDRDFVDAIERRIITNPTIIADYHLPRKGDANARPDKDVATYFGAEESQGKAPPGIEHLRCRPYKESVKKPPKLDEPTGSPTESRRQPKTG
jgi:hypothetical protein